MANTEQSLKINYRSLDTPLVQTDEDIKQLQRIKSKLDLLASKNFAHYAHIVDSAAKT